MKVYIEWWLDFCNKQLTFELKLKQNEYLVRYTQIYCWQFTIQGFNIPLIMFTKSASFLIADIIFSSNKQLSLLYIWS